LVVKSRRKQVAQDDYYYEIQLTNKQLVFYFMAGATGLILSFLAGVMVGKGVDASAGDVQAARPAAEERVVAEEPITRPTTPPPAEDLTYAQRLEGDRQEEASLEKSRPAASSKGAKPSPAPRASATPKAAASPRPTPQAETHVADAGSTPAPPSVTKPAPAPAPETKPAPATVRPSPKDAPKASPSPSKPAVASFTIQVGAFKDKATADSVITRLKSKGFAAYLVAPESEGSALFNVRVGSYPARTDAERVQAKLRDQEKFKPFIVKN
jgi:cell division protein FtsN